MSAVLGRTCSLYDEEYAPLTYSGVPLIIDQSIDIELPVDCDDEWQVKFLL